MILGRQRVRFGDADFSAAASASVYSCMWGCGAGTVFGIECAVVVLL
jgi:hypothetical protein